MQPVLRAFVVCALPSPLQDQSVRSTIDPLFREMIANPRIVGGFLKRKAEMFNARACLFVVSVTLYALGFCPKDGRLRLRPRGRTVRR